MSYCRDLMKECNELLSHGIMNTIISSHEKTIHQNLISFFEKSTYEDIKKAKSRGFNFKFEIPINGIPTFWDLGGSDSEQKFRQLKEHIQRLEVEEMSLSETSFFLSQNVDATLVQVWERTMANVLEHCSAIIYPPPIEEPPTPTPDDGSDRDEIRYGLQYRIDESAEYTRIRIFYVKVNESDSYPVVTSFKIIGGEIIDGALEPGTTISDEKLITIKQTGNNSALLLISTDKQDLDIKFSSTVLDAIFLRVCLFTIPISPFQHVYTKKVPKYYKIIGGGFNVTSESCIPTSSYPSSLNEWTVKFTSKIESLNNQFLKLSLITIYDPHDQWM